LHEDRSLSNTCTEVIAFAEIEESGNFIVPGEWSAC